jgi:predicted ATPase/DNA-binding CsgD family transcriptional regulator
MRYAERSDALASPQPPAHLVPFPTSPSVTPALPQPLSSFVGRAADVAALVDLLTDRAVRLLTLIGPGGIGKTRLALAAATTAGAHFPDGVAFVELAAVSRPELVLPTICQALGLREVAGRDRGEQLHAFLAEKQLLLVVDNCEHLLAAAPDIAAIATKAPGVTLLVTSRAPLRVTGEQEFPVTPLSLPRIEQPLTAASLLVSDAARLFITRARAHDRSFTVDRQTAPHIAEICERLDGLPLAIELAAARVKVLTPRQLRDRLERRLPFLTAGARNAPFRHGTMRDAIAWSYDLLTPLEQRFFRCLSVFAGGCTLAAVESVSGTESDALDMLVTLVEQSLLERDSGPDDEPRFRMLETIREYGLERLAPEEADAARAAHARYYLDLAQSLRPLLNIQATSAALERLSADDANLSAALAWLDEHGPEADFVAMVAACCTYWYSLSHLRDAETWITRALAKQDRATASDRSRLLMAHAEQLMVKGDYEEAESAFVAGIPLVRAAGDPFDIAMALFTYGVCLTFAGKGVAGEEALAEVLAGAEAIADPTLRAAVTAGALANLSVTARSRGDLALAEARSEEALRMQDAMDFDLAVLRSLVDLGEIAREQGNYPLAAEHYLSCVMRTGRRGEKRLIADALTGIASIASTWEQHRSSLLLFGAAEALREREGIAMMLPGDAAVMQRELGALREVLGEASFGAILREGRALPFTEVVAVAAMVVPPAPSPHKAASGTIVLTQREREVLELLAAGKTDRQIAEALYIGLRTVSWHVSTLLTKLDAGSRHDAVERARAAGFN